MKKAQPSFSFDTATKTICVGETFVSPTLSGAEEGMALTWRSSNNGVATVNQLTGQVTPLSTGTTVITVSYAGDAYHTSAQASYTLYVLNSNEPGDVNGDGQVGIGDIVAITNIMAGIGTTTNPEAGKTKTYTVNGVSFVMVGVEGGTFQMGSTDGNDNEQPVHSVTLSSFSIGQTEVTQQLWYAVMGQMPTADGLQWRSDYGQGDQYPAYYVSWDDCQEFITKLNQLTASKPTSWASMT